MIEKQEFLNDRAEDDAELENVNLKRLHYQLAIHEIGLQMPIRLQSQVSKVQEEEIVIKDQKTKQSFNLKEDSLVNKIYN